MCQANGPPRNLLEAHWERNRFPNPPNPDSLAEAASSHRTSTSMTTSSSASTRPSSVSSHTSTRRKRNSIRAPTANNAKPVNLRYYSSTRWGDLLEESKPLYQLFFSIKQAFPSTDEGFKEAKEVIDEMVKTFTEKGIVLEESK